MNSMKKKYIKPRTNDATTDLQLKICNISTEGGNVNIEYGGVDLSGSLSPSTKGRHSRYDDSAAYESEMDIVLNESVCWSDTIW